ncbi:MAG: glycoside hydrolase 43 family protein [Muribaculaceae bacterium]|nr:glycoside hydrolase 43 family protein [Muribaculaceae bacterium]
MRQISVLALSFLLAVADFAQAENPKSWSADNGNGTFTNPLFYDEFSDPDVIRVGEDYYLAGTTMHSVPGLVILHSKDLVNWENVSYCFDRFDFEDDAFSLKNGKEVYGQGIWAPCIRHHDGKFYLFSNVNGKGLQCFTSESIEGPWKHSNMQGNIYDLGVIFDDDGKVYAVHGYDEVKCTELKADMSGPVEGTERIIIPKGSGVGEGHHIYKIDGRYYIVSADYAPNGRLTCSRADNIWGPYETRVITADETFGYHMPPMTNIRGRIMPDSHPVSVNMPDPDQTGACNIHQGGIVSTPDGQWWALQMQDFHSLGRTTCLVPVTWKDGWPMIGLEGNLGRAPRTWLKPETAARDTEPIHAPYERNEDFNGKTLGRVWQWNHNPDDSRWKLNKGRLRLSTMPADQLMWARNTLTQRAIGPESDVTVELYLTGLKDGDVAGLGNINVPCSWIGVVKDGGKLTLRRFEQLRNDTLDVELSPKTDRIWLRLHGDYDVDRARYCYSMDGESFMPLGDDMTLSYQLITFQGSRPGLFAFNVNGKNGGYAEFDNFTVDEMKADRSGNIPLGKKIHIINLATGRPMHATRHGLVHDTAFGARNAETEFKVIDRGNGKVILQTGDGRYVFTSGEGLPGDVRLTPEESKADEFMWQDYLDKEFMLMSMRTHKYLGKSPTTGSPYSMDFKGADPARRNGAVFRWEEKP